MAVKTEFVNGWLIVVSNERILLRYVHIVVSAALSFAVDSEE